MFIPLKMVIFIGIDPYSYLKCSTLFWWKFKILCGIPKLTTPCQFFSESIGTIPTALGLSSMATWGACCQTNPNILLLVNSYGYGSIPIDTFLVGWISIYQLFWGSLGTRVLTHPHISYIPLFIPIISSLCTQFWPNGQMYRLYRCTASIPNIPNTLYHVVANWS